MLEIKDREIYDLRQKNTNLEMQIADLKNQNFQINDT
jgi:hypothetical protein